MTHMNNRQPKTVKIRKFNIDEKYHWKNSVLNPAPGSNTWGSTQTNPYSFTTIAAPAAGTVDTNLKGISLKGLIVK